MAEKATQRLLIHFYFDGVNITLRNRKRLKAFINKLILNEKKELKTLNYVFCSDKTLLDINRKYLNHNFYTDVITFDLSTSHRDIFADIYISADRIRGNAKILKLSVNEELHRVIFHGLLHLCGYNDKTQGQRNRMQKKEDLFLSLYRRFTWNGRR